MLHKVFAQAGLILLFESRLFLFLAFRLIQFSDISLLWRLVWLECRNFYGGSACQLGQQYAGRQM